MILLIYGSGGFGREILDMALLDGRWDKFHFINDFENGHWVNEQKVISYQEAKEIIKEREDVEVVIGIGEPKARKTIYDKLVKDGFKLAKIISKTAIISKSSSIGDGCIICDYSCIHADTKIADNSVIHLYVALGHGTKIGKHSVICTHAAPGGNMTVGEGSFIGMNASVREGIRIGDNSVVSMGAVVYKDVEDGETVVGNPARVTRRNADGTVFR